MRNLLVYFFIAVFLPIYGYGQASLVIDLKAPNLKKQLAGKITYFEDKSGKMPSEKVFANFDKQKVTLPTAQANFRQSPSAFWFRFDIKHAQWKTENWLAEIPYPSLDYVDFYYKDEKGDWKIEKSGDRILFYERSIHTKINAFKLVFHNDSIHTFYIRVQTGGVLQIPFNFQEINTFFLDNANEEALLGTFYGMMLALSLYNLFLFFVLYDKAYIWYALYMILAVLFTGSMIGHTFQYLFPYTPYMIEPCLIISGNAMCISVIIFIQTFLNTKEKIKKVNLIINILKIIAILNIFIYILFGYTTSVQILLILAPATTFSILITSIYASYKKLPAANILAFAFVSMVFGTVIYSLMQLNYLPHNLFVVHAVRLGFGIQGLVFSLALADRYKQLKKQILDQEREANETLEGKVQNRTEQLRHLHQELITQNEELQQTQEEILAQRDAIEYKNRELGNQNAQIQNSIRAAKAIQKAIVPYQQKRDDLLRDYFVIYRPRDVVSGDFYWLNKVGDSIFLAVVDCTGHGVPGAFMTLITNNLLDKIVRVWDIYSPAEILNRLHEDIEVVLRQKETENNYGMDMCVLVSTPQPNDTFNITFAGAKQSLYYIPHTEDKIKILYGKRKSIGGFQRSDIVFANEEVILEKGSQIYLSSDGYLDQNDVKRKKIGEKQFIDFVNSMHTEEMPIQKQKLIQYLYNHMQDTIQRDDILVIGVKL